LHRPHGHRRALDPLGDIAIAIETAVNRPPRVIGQSVFQIDGEVMRDGSLVNASRKKVRIFLLKLAQRRA
jgi:hypothetical protein